MGLGEEDDHPVVPRDEPTAKAKKQHALAGSQCKDDSSSYGVLGRPDRVAEDQHLDRQRILRAC